MSACYATVTVAGIGTFTCEIGPSHQRNPALREVHCADVPTDGMWATITWSGEDHAVIAPPGSRGRL